MACWLRLDPGHETTPPDQPVANRGGRLDGAELAAESEVPALVASHLRGVPGGAAASISSSMHANRPAVVMYDRGRGVLPATPSFPWALSDPALLVKLRDIAFELG